MYRVYNLLKKEYKLGDYETEIFATALCAALNAAEKGKVYEVREVENG